MTRLILKLGAVLLPAVIALSVAGLIDAAALTNPATMAPRDFNTQQTGYLRIHIKASGTGITANGNSCVAAVTGGANCSVKVGAIPANAMLVRMTQQIVVNFNADTADTIGLGTNTTGANILTPASVHTGAGAISNPSFTAGGSGTLLTTGVAQTGLNGGFDVYAKYTYTASTIATAGEVVIVLEYIAPNDGDCVATPLNVTPTSC